MIYKNYLIKRTEKYGAPCLGVFQQENKRDALGRYHLEFSSYPVYTAKTVRECKEGINCHFGRL